MEVFIQYKDTTKSIEQAFVRHFELYVPKCRFMCFQIRSMRFYYALCVLFIGYELS